MQYLAERNYELAYDKFMSCLAILMSLLHQEPFGLRGDLLLKQVTEYYFADTSFFRLIVLKRCGY